MNNDSTQEGITISNTCWKNNRDALPKYSNMGD